MAVNKDIMRQWAEALESGKYGQTHGKLGDGQGSFCCLGVLCEIAVKDDAIQPPVYEAEEGQIRYGFEAAILPTSVQNWSGLTESNPLLDVPEELSYSHDTETAINLNDDYDFDFLKIAACVRYTYDV